MFYYIFSVNRSTAKFIGCYLKNHYSFHSLYFRAGVTFHVTMEGRKKLMSTSVQRMLNAYTFLFPSNKFLLNHQISEEELVFFVY